MSKGRNSWEKMKCTKFIPDFLSHWWNIIPEKDKKFWKKIPMIGDNIPKILNNNIFFPLI